jgi:hypothetical protein
MRESVEGGTPALQPRFDKLNANEWLNSHFDAVVSGR